VECDRGVGGVLGKIKRREEVSRKKSGIVNVSNKVASEISKEKKRWELILALASNPNMIVTFQGNDDRYYPDIKTTNTTIFNQADAIIKQLEEEKR
jgi:hypothetical protein